MKEKKRARAVSFVNHINHCSSEKDKPQLGHKQIASLIKDLLNKKIEFTYFICEHVEPNTFIHDEKSRLKNDPT